QLVVHLCGNHRFFLRLEKENHRCFLYFWDGYVNTLTFLPVSLRFYSLLLVCSVEASAKIRSPPCLWLAVVYLSLALALHIPLAKLAFLPYI
ncbi:MAG: hypothetical protein D8H98_17540, partial [Prevotella sp.]